MCSFACSALFANNPRESVNRFVVLFKFKIHSQLKPIVSYGLGIQRYIFFFQVLLDKLALDKEKHTLLQENQQLRAVLKQYLDGMFLYFNLTIKQIYNF